MAKRALLVGINSYPNPANALGGCLNDVQQVSRLLRENFGFDRPDAIRTLADGRATTKAIKSGLGWLVDGASPNDVLVFHYSGHGSQVPDRHGDEDTDGLDEIICPYDLDWDAPFTDDDLHAAVRGVPASANLTIVLDCCHAGTGVRELRRWKYLPPPGGYQAPGAIRRRPVASVRWFGRKAAKAGAILIAACREDQMSADAFIDGDYHGALTYYFCRTIEQAGYALTYAELIRRLRGRLRAEGFDQDPQLEGAHEAVSLPVFAAALAQWISAVI